MTINMKAVLFLTISIGLIFVAQTASILKQDEENNVAGDAQEREKITVDAATQTEDDFFSIEENQPGALDDLWSNNNLQLFEQFLQILRRPYNTLNQITTQLEPFLTVNQLERIRIKVYTSQGNDEFTASPFDIETEQIEKSAESNQKFLDEDTNHKIHSRKNPTMDVIPDNDLSPEITNQLADFMARYAANKLIDVIENEIVSQSEPSKISLQSDQYISPDIDENRIDGIENEIESQSEPSKIPPQTNQYISPDIGENRINSIQQSNQTRQGPNKITPRSDTYIAPLLTNPYTLPGFDKNFIDGLQAPFDHTWQGPDYQVRLKRNFPDEDVELWWKKGEDNIYLHRLPNGAADQNWGFGTVHIALFRDEDSNQMQFWNFDLTKLKYFKDKNQAPQRTWELDHEDEASYWKCRHIIKLWCQANGFFVGGQEFCIIY